MKKQYSVISLTALLFIGIFHTLKNNTNTPNTSEYELLALAEYQSAMSFKLPSQITNSQFSEKSIFRNELTSARISTTTESRSIIPMVNAGPIAKFLNGNLPSTTPTTNIPNLLSQTGAFTSTISLEPTNGLIPYEMIEPFWSDGAAKLRWMSIPNNGTYDTAEEQIILSENDAWDFPKGAVLIKHFELGGKRLETRFEVKGEDNVYYFLSYKWNESQTDAVLLNNSIDEEVVVNGTPQTWHYPSRAECVSCHFEQNGSVLGPKTRNLNKTITYDSGVEKNQLVYLSELGIINQNITIANVGTYPAVVAKNDTSASLEDRARTYIDINCASCHNPQVENIALFDARYSTPLQNQDIINGAVIYDEGLSNPQVIVPQDVANSMLHFRMNSTETGIEMPPLAKDVVDSQGVALIAAWINSLTPTTVNPPVAVFSASTVYGPSPLSVDFDATASFDEDGDNLSYSWDFGDSSTGQGITIGHVYTNPGSYNATLTVSDGELTDQSTTTITVSNNDPGSQVMSFTDNTNLILQDNFSGLAMGVIDMNGDGKDDIVQFNSGRNLRIQYQAGRNQVFSSYEFGQVSNRNQWSTAVADYDHNGYNDILAGGAYDQLKIISNNNGSNSYTASILPSSNIFIQGSNFIDINNDGWADIFACHDDAESRAYQNNQNGTFTFSADLLSTETDPVSDNSGNYASMWVDYDNDGDLDLYISKCRGGVTDSNDPRRINMLWQNDGNNNFVEVAEQANLKIGDQTWLTDFGDIDNDGDLDAIVINHGTGPNLMRNNGNGTFTEITANSGLLPTLRPQDFYGIQGFFRDFNNDGHLDLMVSGSRHFIFYNNGDGTFKNANNPFNSNNIQSFSVGDLNHDGFLDIYAGHAVGLNSPSSTKDRIWINDGNSNNFFNVQLTGTQSNINGIGARVELHGAWGIQIRDVRSGEGYGLVNSFTQHFGIGTSTGVNKVIVRWPSGIVDEIQNPEINQFLQITENQTINVSSVVISPTEVTLTEGFDTQLTATITPDNATYQDVIWSTSNSLIATVDDTGLATAVSEGTVTITATTVDGNFTTIATVIVEPQIISVTGISLTPQNASVTVGETRALSTTITPTDATDQSILWFSSNSNIVRVNQNGLITGLSTGAATITASTMDGNFTATTSISVEPEVVLVSGISITPQNITLTTGESFSTTIQIQPANATNNSVTWSTNDTAIASVDEAGRVTATSAGETFITVRTEDGGYEAQITVSVEDPISQVSVYNVIIEQSSVTLNIGENFQLNAQVEPENASNQTITWFSNNTSIATINPDTGMVTATGAGEIDVTAVTEDGEYKASAVITVLDNNAIINVYDIVVTPEVVDLIVGETFTMFANVEPLNATNQTISWFSNNAAIASVDSNTGVVTAMGSGEIDITAVSEDGGFSASSLITVVDNNAIIDVYNIIVTTESANLMVGDTYTLLANVEPLNATNQGMSWFSNNPAIASVDTNTGIVTAIGAGEIDITVVSADGGFTASAIISVTGEAAIIPVYNVYVAPSIVTLDVGSTLQLTASVEPLDATDNQVTWFSNNSDIASIDPNTGLVTAIQEGEIDVTVTTNDGGFSASALIKVTSQANSIRIYPNPTSGILNFDLSGFMNTAVTIKVFNQNNQLLETNVVDQNHMEEITLNFNGYPEGFYYLLFQTTNGGVTKTFIIRY